MLGDASGLYERRRNVKLTIDQSSGIRISYAINEDGGGWTHMRQWQGSLSALFVWIESGTVSDLCIQLWRSTFHAQCWGQPCLDREARWMK